MGSFFFADRKGIRMTFASPTALTLYLPHATLPISTFASLYTFLTSELRLGLLERFSQDGEKRFGGRWALDKLDAACIGFWDRDNDRKQITM